MTIDNLAGLALRSFSRVGAARLLLVLGSLCGVVRAAPVAGQSRLFPDVPAFELPIASPRVYGLAGRVLAVRKGESLFGAEREAEAAVGGVIPLLALARGPRPVTLGFGVEATGRFSLDDSKSALISNDWLVGFNTDFDLGRWGVTLEVYHESSHLGDEYRDHFLAARIDWTHEVVAVWLRRNLGPWRLHSSVGYFVHDQLPIKRSTAALGADYRGHPFRFLKPGTMLIGGVYADALAETKWRVTSTARLGLAFRGFGRNRELTLSMIYLNGLSSQRQFYRRESRYVGTEIRFAL